MLRRAKSNLRRDRAVFLDAVNGVHGRNPRWTVKLPRMRHMDSDTALSASSISALYQFQGRIAPTTNKAWHCPFPESAVAPLDFALEGLRDAKRVHEKTKGGRARDARQEL